MRYLTENLPGTGGLIKAVPEDFVVEELPAYPPSGEGQHILLLVEKVGVTTHEMIRRVALALRVNPRDVGVAGQKDRQAIARQLVSVPADHVRLDEAANLKVDQVQVLSAARHGNKLRIGHLRGNRFTIVVRGVGEGAGEKARAVLDHLMQSWVPNRFGAQRFGMHGDNADQGKALLLGKIRIADRFRKRLYLSAYQSALFNRYLDERMDEGLLHRVVVGDVLQRTPTGGLFACVETDLAYTQARLEMRRIVPTGPIFGHEMFATLPGSPAEARERRILDEEGITLATFEPFGRLAEGTRRALLARIEGTTVRQEDDRLTVAFALPAGAYATVVLDEIMKSGQPVAHPGDK